MAQFRTKARAVELLGKGQIADLPTAISELWKNGYDAYADKLQCNLYLTGYKDIKKPFFTLSDDGFGMSQEEILSKWIILGTDSKARGSSSLTSESRLNKDPRIPMGEKGIGRLSVAYLGSPMLMITKKKNNPCQMLFIDWRILENYNLFIDDIDIPVSEFNSINEFKREFKRLSTEFICNLTNEHWEEQWSDQLDTRDDIITDVENVEVPTFFVNEFIDKATNTDSHGTIFLIFNPHEQLLELSDSGNNELTNDKTLTEFRKSLSGLYNIFKGESEFSTEFNIFDSIGKYNILDDFFTPEDLKASDHWFKGSFDENGFFSGEVRVFQQRFQHTFRPIRKPGKTPYGPFEIELSFNEGERKSSILTPEQYDYIDRKTDKFGGLYIYRDGFRVLPYGRTDYDFLGFEERRSKKAGYYFFSHRNMYGYIDISREKNRTLTDKAGREGFVTNKSYREFQEDLIQFFVDLASTYFRSIDKDSLDSNSRNEQIGEIKRQNEKILESEKKRSKLTKAKFTSDLKNNQEEIGLLELEIDDLYNSLLSETQKIELAYNDYNRIVSEIEGKKTKLRELKLVKPKRINLTPAQERNYVAYQSSFVQTFTLTAKCDELIAETRKRFDVQNLKLDYVKRYESSVREISSLANNYKKQFIEFSNRIDDELKAEQVAFVNVFKQEIQNTNINDLSSKEDLDYAISLVNRLSEETKDQIEKKLAPFINHIQGLNFDIDDDYLVGWYKEQNKKIEERMEQTNELAQLGMSIEIIDHQFNVMYSKMADAIKFFKQLATTKPEIEYYYNQLNMSFQHLESNHKLLKPLYRTTRRQRTVIKGSDIETNLKDFFSTIFSRNNIKLTADDSFRNYEFFTFESIIKPVFINIINNAVYWLTTASERKIHISVRDNKILIANNGEKIEDKYINDIFTLFFTKRKDGRGIGLYLARTNLASIGFDIYATEFEDKDNLLKGACFVIKPHEILTENN